MSKPDVPYTTHNHHAMPVLEGKEIAVEAFRLVFWLTTASFALGLVSFMLIEERPLQSSNAAR